MLTFTGYNCILTKSVARETHQSLIIRDLSSAGRASALQAEGHRFEPCRSHRISIYTYHGGIAQLARAHGSYPWCRWFKSSFRYLKRLSIMLGLFLFHFSNLKQNSGPFRVYIAEKVCYMIQ